MLRLLSFSLCTLLSFGSLAQSITLRGKVVDAITLEPLAYASIFINGTTIGVNADESGKFVLENIPEGEYELVCSYVGHETFQVKSANLSSSDELEIKLKPLKLKEIEITEKRDDKWKSQLKDFEVLFLGPGKSSCKILNPWVLDFVEIDDNILIAKASEPIEIENKWLGYNVTYTLREFMGGRTAYNISGVTYFREMQTEDAKLKSRWKENRLKAYLSSSRHLIKSILQDRLQTEGFDLYQENNPERTITRSESFAQNLGVTLQDYKTSGTIQPGKTSGHYNITFPKRLEVHYRYGNSGRLYNDISHAVGWIEVKGGVLTVNQRGIALNPSNMIVSGYLSEARVAHLLPGDFEPVTNSAVSTVSVQEKIKEKLSRLAEQPYIHTDKAYYYPGEIIWMKVYMNYASPWKRDSLSKVLYVDLIANKKIIERRFLPIDNGTSIGTIKIPRTSASGDYFICAYTSWTRNYEDAYTFIKPIKILSLDESVEAEPVRIISSGVSIISDKNVYAKGDKITLKIEATDSLTKPIQADLSVSITDQLQAVPLVHEKTVLSSFPIHVKDQKINTEHPIEYGLTYQGKFTNSKGNSDSAFITIAEETLANIFTLTSNKNGDFTIKSLHFYDSIRLAIKAKGSNGKKGTVKIEDIKAKPISKMLTPLPAKVIRLDGTKRYHVSYVDDTLATQLPEVVIENKRIDQKRTGTIHGKPDVTITGEWLRSTHSNNLLMSLQSRVPGFQVVSFVGSDGTVTYRMKFNTPISFMDSMAVPLVLVNDVPVTMPAGELTQYIMNINPRDVDRIEVIKYGGGAAYGVRGSNGIIAIYLRIPLDEIEPDNAFDPKDFQIFTLAGYSSPHKFKSPDKPEIENSKTTLYWNPSLETDQGGIAELTFFSALRSATYRIVVEGVTVNGEAVRGEKIIVVE